jgi:hypothetical protein
MFAKLQAASLLPRVVPGWPWQTPSAPLPTGPTEAVSAATSARVGREIRPDLEGLRGVAVIAVLLFHLELPWAAGGFVGVDAFFVLSGFLITGLLIREWDGTGRISLPAFYARRGTTRGRLTRTRPVSTPSRGSGLLAVADF